MVDGIRLNLDFSMDNNEKKTEKIKEAESRKKQATETIDEAWRRILTMNNSEADQKRLEEVRQAMRNNQIGRHAESLSKKFSKAEALRLYKELLDRQRDEKLAEMVKKKPLNYILVNNELSLNHLIQEIVKSDLVAFDIETFGEEKTEDALDPYKGKVAGFSLSSKEYHFYVPLNHKEQDNLIDDLTALRTMNRLKPYLEKVKTVMHNARFDCTWFWLHYEIDMITNLFADTRVMAFLLDEGRSHRLKDLATDWLGIESDNFDELFGKTPFNQIPVEVAVVYACKDTALTLSLFNWIMKWFDKDKEDFKKLKSLCFDIEMPVLREFIRADLRGIGFDVDRAKKLDNDFGIEEAQLVNKIFELLGEKLNLNSPAQLSKKLYEDMKLPDYDKGSTGVKTLKKLKKAHEVIPLILEYRELSKLRTSFTQSLPTKVQKDGRIHPSHNSLGAKTGRFTCKDPNTQQIPSKRPEIRKLFTSGEGRILIGADLSQIELRIVAVMAKEEIMLEAFRKGKDMHSTTASRVSGIPYERIEEFKDVEGTPEQKARKTAKVLNFAILYGMGAKGLAEMLGCSDKEAQEYIDSFFKGYPAIDKFMKDNVAFIEENGYTVDMFGRKRRFHEVMKSKDKFKKFSAFRQGNNFPVQSSAGVVLKLAITKLQEILPDMDVHILLQIHDELIFDCPDDIAEEQVLLIKNTIETCIELPVPLKSDVEIYPERWAEAKTLKEWFEAA